MTIETDVLVIGGGIAGASTAYHLAALGHRVVLLERGEIASGASGVNGGLVDSVGWGRTRDLHAHLTAGSLEIFETVQQDFSTILWTSDGELGGQSVKARPRSAQFR